MNHVLPKFSLQNMKDAKRIFPDRMAAQRGLASLAEKYRDAPKLSEELRAKLGIGKQEIAAE